MEKINPEDAKNEKQSVLKDIEDEEDDGAMAGLFDESKEIDVIPEFGNCGGQDEDDEQIDSSAQSNQNATCCKNTQQSSLTDSILNARSRAGGQDCECKDNSGGRTNISAKQKQKAARIQSKMTDSQATFLKDINFASLTPAQIKELVKAGKICFKCRTSPPNYANKQDKVCKQCFMESIVTRFKASLRLQCKIWKDDLNLVCISGGSCSMALLDLVYDALFGVSITNRKIFCKVHVLYIDEGPAVYDWTDEFHKEKLQMIRDVCTKYKFTYTILPIESVFDIDSNLLDMKTPSVEEQKIIDDEKADDYENFTVFSQNLEEVKDKYVQVQDHLDKRQKFKNCPRQLKPKIQNFRLIKFMMFGQVDRS